MHSLFYFCEKSLTLEKRVFLGKFLSNDLHFGQSIFKQELLKIAPWHTEASILLISAKYNFVCYFEKAYMPPRAVFWNLVMLSFPFLPFFNIHKELAISQGTTFSFFNEISLKTEKMKMLSLMKLPILSGYQRTEGKGRITSQGFRKRPLGACRHFQNGGLLIFRFLKFLASECTI